jgi:hypothetical protein
MLRTADGADLLLRDREYNFVITPKDNNYRLYEESYVFTASITEPIRLWWDYMKELNNNQSSISCQRLRDIIKAVKNSDDDPVYLADVRELSQKLLEKKKCGGSK